MLHNKIKHILYIYIPVVLYLSNQCQRLFQTQSAQKYIFVCFKHNENCRNNHKFLPFQMIDCRSLFDQFHHLSYFIKSILYYVNFNTHNRHKLDLMLICVSVKCIRVILTYVGLC